MIALLTLALCAQDAPKVLLVDIDDVGFELVAESNTPTLDWLEKNGRTYTNFVTAPVCSPTRAMIHLGARPSHPDVLVGQIVAWDADFALEPKSLVPLGKLVADAGHTTAKVGKWHLCGETHVDHPRTFGWQHYRGLLANTRGSAEFYTSYPKVIDGEVEEVEGRYLTTDETNDALRFVREGTALISVSYHAPHKPWHEPPAELHTVESFEDDHDRARAMLEACDRELGRLVAEALTRGYLVIVCSDNGAPTTVGGGKGQVWDIGIHVPMWAIGPGVEPGRDDSTVCAVDLYDTIAELFEVPCDDPTRGPDSLSFARTLRGQAMDRPPSYVEAFKGNGKEPRGNKARWSQALRGKRFKLIRKPPEGLLQMFDLQEDPRERVDLMRVRHRPAAAHDFINRWGDLITRD